MKVRKLAINAPETDRVRVRPCGDEPGVVQLSLADQAIVPTSDELARWIHHLTVGTTDTTAVHTIRTGALFPDAAAVFAEAGFEVIDTLALLQADLDDVAPLLEGARATRTPARTTTLRARHHAAAARIDRLAFGPAWANDVEDLVEIRRATAQHHACGRFGGGRLFDRELLGFAITGGASGQGYLQRLAVDPRHQHEGHGRQLTLDSLRWMRRRRLTSALVNTSMANEPAQALYASVGFRPLADRLRVMCRTVSAP